MKKRLLSLVLAACMLLGMLPGVSLAAGEPEPTCGHTHDASCIYAPAVMETPCTCVDIDIDGAIDHAADCGYVPALAEVPCNHECDEICGGLPPVIPDALVMTDAPEHMERAAGTAWDGTATESVTADSEGVYTITNGAQLAWVAAQVNAGTNNFNDKTIKLGDNIDLASKPWTPIGNSSKYFSGTFDGMGHTVANLTITGIEDYQGLFGYARPMNIRNLGVVNCSVSGGDPVGAIVGELAYGNLYNCYSTGAVTGSSRNSYVGGIVGNNSGGLIQNCYSTATVGLSAGTSSSYVGGIAGDTRHLVAGYYLASAATIGVGNASASQAEIRNFTDDTLNSEIEVYSLDERTKPATTSLLQALNHGVDNYLYFTWLADSGNVNGGYPVFGPKYEPPHTHGVNGGSGSQTYTAWTSKTALPTDAGSYYLKEDVTLPADWVLALKTINLCLNGHTISTGTNMLSLLGSRSNNSATVLNLCDCQTAGTITGGTKTNGEGIAVQIGYGEASPTFNMYGGKITGSDRGVALSSSGFGSPPVFNMYGGKISGNTTGIEYGSGTVNLDGTVALNGNTGAAIEYRSDNINDIRPITLGTKFITTTTIGVIAGNQTNGEPLTGALTKAFGSDVSSKFTYAGEHPLLVIANGADNAVQLKFRESWTDKDNYDAELYATAAGDWQIADAADLAAFSKKLNEGYGLVTFRDATVTLTGDIDLTGKLWNPIKNFEGTFDGGGHTISGMEAAAYSTRNEVYSGLFATLSDATAGVRNLTVSGTSTALSTRSTAYAGGIVAGMYGKSAATPAFLENCVSNVVVTATSPGKAYAGGIAGTHENSRMINCVNNGAVTANAGSAENTDCTANAGGLAGCSIWSGDDGPVCINNSYNTGAVTAKATTKDSSSAAYAGGIVGGLDSDNLRNCYNVGAVSATADTKVAGGVVGQNVSGAITSCYYLAASETDSESGTTFQTSDAMKAADFVAALNGWVTANTTDFSDAMHWKQETGQNSGYPFLTAPPVADPEAEWTPTGGTKTTGTFAEALAAMVTSGGSIKLLKDVSTADAVTLPAATIALDLDSKTWTAGGQVTVQSGCKLTVTGNSAGKLLVTVPAFAPSVLVASGGAMTMTGGNIVAKPEITTAVMVETSAEFTFTGGSIDSNAGDGVGNQGTFTMSAPATITAGKVAIRNSGGKVYLSGGTVQSGESNSAVENNATLYLSGAPTLTPSNGRKQINNGASALIVANDGASTPVPFTGTATVSCSFSTEVGHTVISGLTDAEHAAKFTVSGPGDPIAIAYVDGEKAVKTVYKTYAIIYKDGVSGADFSGTHGENHPTTHTYNTATTLVDATKNGFTFGGWFTDSACTEGNKVTTLAAIGYEADITLYAKWTATPPAPTVDAKWGTDGTYAVGSGSITDAVSYANALTSGTAYIQLQRNVSCGDTITFDEGKTTVLDLNGCTVAGNHVFSIIAVTGNLTMKDSGTGGAVIATSPQNYSGSGVSVTGDGHFTLEDGRIGPTLRSGVIVNPNIAGEHHAKFTMTGGSISGNKGQGVELGSNSDTSTAVFTMSGGKISGNGAGGVAVGSHTTLNMSGGEITGNNTTTDRTGGGVTLVTTDATVNLSGSAKITGNVKTGVLNEGTGLYTGDTPCNVYLGYHELSGERHIGGGAFTSGASIGVTVENPPTTGDRKITAIGGSEDYAAVFTSDDPAYEVFNKAGTVGTQDAYLRKVPAYSYTVTFDSQNATTAASPASKTVTDPATTIDALPTPPVKAGHDFGGWFTATNGSGTEFTASTTVTGNLTLYAKWTQNVTPDKPVLTVEKYTALGGTKPRIALFANGRAVTAAEGITAAGNKKYTKLYYTDDSTKTTIDLNALTKPSDVTFTGNTTDGYYLSEVWLYGGSNGKKVTGDTKITVTGGMVGSVVGGGRGIGGDVSGTSTITVTATTATTLNYYVGAANGGKIEGGAFFSSATSAAYSIRGYVIDNGSEAAKTDFTVKLGGSGRVGVQGETTNDGGVLVSGQSDTRGIDIKTVQIDPAWAANASDAYILFDVASVFKDGDVVATGAVGDDADKYKATTCVDYLWEPTELQNSTEIKGDTVVVNLGKATPPGHVPVTGITGVPTTATAGIDLTLTGTVAPASATNKAIVWSVKTAGTTGATITGTTLSTTAAGTVTVTATIANGQTASTPFTKDFTITVAAVPATYTVTYNGNGSTGGTVPTDATQYAAAASVTVQGNTGTLTKTGHIFAGWNTKSDGSGTTYAASGTFTIAANTTLYAQWTPVFDVGGSITDSNDQNVSGAAVTIKLGNTEKGRATTDSSGAFTIGGIPNGVYQLIITSGDLTVTKTITVNGGNLAVGTVQLPAGKQNSVVEVKPGTPDIVVGGLDEQFTATAIEGDKGITQSDKDVITNGGEVEIRLTVQSKDNTAPNAADIIQVAGGKTLVFLDLTAEKTVKPSGGSAATTTLTELQKLLDTRIPLSAAQQGKTDYTIYRYHGAKVDTITTTPNSDGEKLELIDGGKTLLLQAKKFSTYAIGYAEVPETPPSPPSDSDSSVTTYAITTTAGEGGTISPRGKVYVNRNANKTFSITPNEGYEIADVLVDGKSVGAVKSYTFEKVTSKHTLEASFRKEVKNPFTDVTEDDWFYDAVLDVLENGIMEGTSADKFSPYLNTSRGMIATILWRLEGEPTAKEAIPFADVTADAYYAKAVAWAAENGIVKGYGNGNYGPNAPITREQLLAVLWRYSGSPILLDYEGLAHYTDTAKISSWATQAIAWAHEQGLFQGKGDNILDPTGGATRGEVAAIFMRLATANSKK